MAKKVLIVESSLAVRGIAESLLRQNGYDVMAADAAGMAREILDTGKVDLILVGSDLVDEQGKPYYEYLRTDKIFSTIPIIILHDPAAGEIGYPRESIINKPFTPREFLESVSGIAGGAREANGNEPFSFDSADFEDDLIDSALGLDKIEVNGSEVLEADSATLRKTQGKKGTEELIGFKAKVPAEDSSGQVRKIDAVNLPPENESSETIPSQTVEEKAPVRQTGDTPEFLGSPSRKSPARPPDKLSESSKIEIVTDQYGIIIPEGAGETGGSKDDDDSHDYEWFLRELQKETTSDAEPPQDTAKRTEIAKAPRSIAPESKTGKAETSADSESAAGVGSGSVHSQAVDKFISEFKKEVEKITGDAPPEIEVTTIPVSDQKAAAPEPILRWEDGLEPVTPTEIRGMSKQLIDAIADKIAERIVAGLDEERVFRILKEAIDQALGRKESVRKK
jgi:two-component system cell cycle response regulator DivK